VRIKAKEMLVGGVLNSISLLTKHVIEEFLGATWGGCSDTDAHEIFAKTSFDINESEKEG